DDALDHDLIFRARDSQVQALVTPVDRVAEHLRVQIDASHHHEDDVDHDVVLERLVDPYRVRLLGGEAGDAQRFQDIPGIIGPHHQIDVMGPARAANQRRGEPTEDEEGVAGLLYG